MKHKHHIIPKHMGGSDDPTNIVELTIEEHAEAHRILWEQYGKKGGAAGKGVTGNRRNGAISNWKKNKDKILQTLRENGKKYGHLGGAKRDWIWINNEKEELKILKDDSIPNGWKHGRLPMNESTRQKIKNSTIGKINKGPKTKEAKEKMSKWRKGRKWYHNPDTLESSMFSAEELIPVGWIPGRVKINISKQGKADKDLAKEVRDGGHDKKLKKG